MDSQHPPSFCSSTPHFFQMILNDNCKQKLKIPKKFVMKYGKELSSSVCIKLPSGSEWEMGLTRCHGKIWFEKGWPDFSVFYSLDYGHFLVFRYEGNSHFHVCICDLSATEIDYPVTIPEIEKADEDDDLSVEILEGFSPTPKRREKSPSPCPPRKKIKTSSLRKEDMISEGEDDANGGSTGSTKFLKQTSRQAIAKALAFQRANDIKSGNPSFTISMQKSDIQTSLSLPWMFAERHLMKQPTSKITLRIRNGRTWLVEFTYTKQKAQFQSGWLTFVKDNNLKVGDACVFLLVKDIKLVLEIIFFPTSESSDWSLPQGNDLATKPDGRDSTSPERFLKRTPHEVLGKMKPLTENKKAYAFKSDKPSFNIIMPPSPIDCDLLSLPNEFAKRYLMNLPTGIATLQVSDGRTWHVKFKYDHENSRARLQKGWSSFARDNKLKVGDACVFTLVNCNEVLFEVDISPTEEYADCHLSTAGNDPAFKFDKPSCRITLPPSSIHNHQLVLPNEFSQRYLTNIPAEVATLKVLGGRTWSVKFLCANSKARFGKGWTDFVRINNMKVGDVCVFTLINCIELLFEVDIIHTKQSSGFPLSTGKNKNSKSSGDVTQRPSSSLPRVNVESADTFASENPFFKVTLQSWHMEKSVVYVPVNFARGIKLGMQVVKLQVKDRSWPVNFIKRGNPSYTTSFCGGWHEFAKANRLREGDVCIFELLETKDIVVEVHIFSGR